MYYSEYTSGFSGPAASHLVAPPSAGYEGNVGQAPSQNIRWETVNAVGLCAGFCCQRGSSCISGLLTTHPQHLFWSSRHVTSFFKTGLARIAHDDSSRNR
jgi:hypothetical protein